MTQNGQWQEATVVALTHDEGTHLLLNEFDKHLALSCDVPLETPLENFRCFQSAHALVVAYCVPEEPVEHEGPLRFIYFPGDWSAYYPDVPWEKAEETFFGSFFLDYHEKRGWIVSSPEVPEEEARLIERRRAALWKWDKTIMALLCTSFLCQEKIFTRQHVVNVDTGFIVRSSDGSSRSYATLKELLHEEYPFPREEGERRFRAFLTMRCETDLQMYNACLQRNCWSVAVEAFDLSGESLPLRYSPTLVSCIIGLEEAQIVRDQLVKSTMNALSYHTGVVRA